MSEEKDLRAAVAGAMAAADAETGWYLDRRKAQVVTVRHGVVSDPLLRARDVEDDELRFVEVPAIAEADLHEWIADFVAESGSGAAAKAFDERAAANARFEERLRRASPETLTEWHRFRQARIDAAAGAWLSATLAADLPGGAGLSPEPS